MRKKGKNRFWRLFGALALCMGAFFMPGEAYAKGGADTAAPSLEAELLGDTLRIKAEDEGSGVDAVFVGGRRVNYRVDSIVELPFGDYAGEEEEAVMVYAVDFAGNESEAVEIANPYFKGAGMDAPEGDTKGRAFTTDGQASVADDFTDGDGQEFYVFTTPEGNEFFLVIDKQRDSDNVYFLNAVTEDDLAALAQKGEKESGTGESAVPEPEACICTDRCEAGDVYLSCAVCTKELRGCLGKEAEPVKEEEKEEEKGSGAAVFILLAALAAGGGGYYLKVYKPRHDLDDAEDLDDLLDDEQEDEEINEEEYGQETEDGPDTGQGRMEMSFYEYGPGYGAGDGPGEGE